MRYSNTPPPTPSTFEKLPCPSLYSAVVTLAAASALSSSNHLVKGDRPAASRYTTTRTSAMVMVTYMLPSVNTEQLHYTEFQADERSERKQVDALSRQGLT